MVSHYLLEEAKRLQGEIAELKAAGLAPDFCSLYEFEKKLKSGGTATYIGRSSVDANGQQRNKYVGRKGSEKHLVWQGKIQRKNRCNALEKQLAMVQEVIRLQDESEHGWAAA